MKSVPKMCFLPSFRKSIIAKTGWNSTSRFKLELFKTLSHSVQLQKEKSWYQASNIPWILANLLQISTMPPPSDSVKNELFLFESERFLWGRVHCVALVAGKDMVNSRRQIYSVVFFSLAAVPSGFQSKRNGSTQDLYSSRTLDTNTHLISYIYIC